jgi:hypothetical protein
VPGSGIREDFGPHMPFHLTPVLIVLVGPFVLWAVLFVLSEYGEMSLKPLKPWLVGASWLLWGFTLIPLVDSLPRPWRAAVQAGYLGTTLVLAWVKRSYLFESKVKPLRSLASLLTVPLPTYIAVRSVTGASPWYTEKFGLRKLAATEQPSEYFVALQFNEKTHPVILVPKDPVYPRPAPVFFTRKVEKVRDKLIVRGVSAGPIQEDRQGTRFFELLDGEGNTVEVSERP